MDKAVKSPRKISAGLKEGMAFVQKKALFDGSLENEVLPLAFSCPIHDFCRKVGR